MRFEPFAEHHIPDALALAVDASIREQQHLPSLATFDVKGKLERAIGEIVRDGTGVAAIEGSELVGYMSFLGPYENFFGTSPGCFSPLHGSATTGPQRRRIFSRLFQHASEIMTMRGARVFAITTYAHDGDAAAALSFIGFGMRCADAIRETSLPLATVSTPGISYREIAWTDATDLLRLKNSLIEHLRRSPTYVSERMLTPQSLAEQCEERGSRFFISQDGDTAIGFMEVHTEGQSYLSTDPGMRNIVGAYLDEPYRGRGIYTNLLGFVIETLREEGIQHLGVDFETMNPTALHFWTRYFDCYTYSLARRLDDIQE